MFRTVIWLAICICIISIFYYSWLPNPDFSNEHYLPTWLITWSNKYGNLRTGVPFIFLGSSLNALFGNDNLNGKTLSKAIILRSYIKITFSCSLIVLIVEIGQFFLPNRNPDLEDIFCGILGSQIGFAIHISLIKCYSYFRNYV